MNSLLFTNNNFWWQAGRCCNGSLLCDLEMLAVETGQLLSLKCPQTSVLKELLVEKIGDRVLLAEPNRPYLRLTVVVLASGCCEISFKAGKPNRCNLFKVSEVSSGCGSLTVSVRLRNLDNVDCAIAVDSQGDYAVHVSGEAPNNIHKDFILSVRLPDGSFRQIFTKPYEFEQWEMRRFALEGYLHLTDMADSSDVVSCIAALNHELGKPGKVVAGGVQGQHGLGKLSGDLSNCSAVRALFSSRIAAAVNTIMGECSYESRNLSAQVAYRFPETERCRGAIGEVPAARSTYYKSLP